MKLKSFALLIAFSTVGVSHASLIHSWELNGNLTDSLGGLSLIADGGTVGASSYAFGANQGLVSNAIIGETYTFSTEFSFDVVDGYRKIWDYQERSSDSGLYNLSGALNFYPVATGSETSFVAGQSSHLVLTRDGATKRVAGFVNGVTLFSFTDSGNLAAATGVSRFFEDDTTTGGREAAAGSVD